MNLRLATHDLEAGDSWVGGCRLMSWRLKTHELEAGDSWVGG
jgi:hypothetical protein